MKIYDDKTSNMSVAYGIKNIMEAMNENKVKVNLTPCQMYMLRKNGLQTLLEKYGIHHNAFPFHEES